MCVEVLQIERSQFRAIEEHRTHVGYVLCVEVLQIERSQCHATGEHQAHVGDVLCVEVLQVKRSQRPAFGEHRAHVGDIFCIEVFQIESSQRRATIEHPTHVFHFRSVEILQPFNLLECFTTIKPLRGGGGTEVSERGIEYHMRGGLIYLMACSCPSRDEDVSLFFHLLDAPCRAGASGTKCIVIEGEGGLVRAL